MLVYQRVYDIWFGGQMVLPRMLLPWMIVGKLVTKDPSQMVLPQKNPEISDETSEVEVLYLPENKELSEFSLPETHIFAPENGWLEYWWFPF